MVPPSTAALQPRTAHQAGYPALTDGHPFAPQLTRDARAAIVATALLMNLAYPLGEPCVLARALTGLATLPGIETAAGNAVESAHHLDRVRVPVCRNEGKDFCFRSEANRIAFFNRSCSIRSRLNCCSTSRNRRNSATDALSIGAGLPTSSPSRTSLRQRE